MRYSVASRFKGTILGGLIAEKTAPRSKKVSPSVEMQVESWHWSDKAIIVAESLVCLGKLEPQDWQSRQQQEFTYLDSYSSVLATLPVALFFHENSIKLRHNLLLVAGQNDPVVRDGILAVGYAIAQSLTEKLAPATLICEIISFIGETPTNLPEKLLKVNQLLVCGAGLEAVQGQFSKEELSDNIALAFYCFLSSIEDFRLSVLRSIQISHRSQVIGAMTGALSGAYNSAVGIPITWQIMLLQAGSEELKQSCSGLIMLADALVAVWSGVYDLALDSDAVKKGGAIAPHLGHMQAVAAPRVIRSR